MAKVLMNTPLIRMKCTTFNFNSQENKALFSFYHTDSELIRRDNPVPWIKLGGKDPGFAA